MNTRAIPSGALDQFRAAASEFARNPAYHASRLEPLRDHIAMMRAKGASFRTISALLGRYGIRASDTCVMRYCHRVLGEEPVRGRKAKSQAAPHKRVTAAPDAVSSANVPASSSRTISESAQVALLDELLSYKPEAGKSNQGGPRIAKIQLANPNDI